ncbi:sulfotransferase domain-containing protein, partial [Alphaproteobacteria bacterium]|nr:sulfotransferase domain-containing protein [Alphaproteobacteria bacterium]
MSKKIFWISSYPKSGNTWVRAIISSLYFTEDGNFNFEILKKIQTFDNIKYFEFIKEISPNDFNNLSNMNVMSKYWQQSQKKIYVGGDFMFLKTHHARIKILNNFFTTAELSRALIYVVRDPRDVLISAAKFHGNEINKELKKLTSSSFLHYNDFSKILYNNQKPLVPLLNWGDHINSWLDFDAPKLIIRYE